MPPSFRGLITAAAGSVFVLLLSLNVESWAAAIGADKVLIERPVLSAAVLSGSGFLLVGLWLDKLLSALSPKQPRDSSKSGMTHLGYLASNMANDIQDGIGGWRSFDEEFYSRVRSLLLRLERVGVSVFEMDDWYGREEGLWKVGILLSRVGPLLIDKHFAEAKATAAASVKALRNEPMPRRDRRV